MDNKIPIQTWDVYFLFSDFLKTRSDIEGFNSNTFSNYENRITMVTQHLYHAVTNNKIGVLSSQQTLIQTDDIYTSLLTNSLINIFDSLIVPNHTTGYILKKNGQHNENPYKNLDYIFPPRSITQDMIGRKVVVLKMSDTEFGKINWKIELYDQDI